MTMGQPIDYSKFDEKSVTDKEWCKKNNMQKQPTFEARFYSTP